MVVEAPQKDLDTWEKEFKKYLYFLNWQQINYAKNVLSSYHWMIAY